MILSRDFRKVLATEVTGASSPEIRISTERYQKAMKAEMESLQDWMAERREKALNFKLSSEMLEKIRDGLQDYPRLPFLLKLIEKKNPNELNEELRKVWDYRMNLMEEGLSYDSFAGVREAITLLMDLHESIGDLSKMYLPETVEEKFNEVMKQTGWNMDKIEKVIQAAISRIPDWHGYPVVIVAEPNRSEMLRDRHDFAPAENATVKLETGVSYPPNFSLFMREGGEVHIDDVLDAGDTDFFTDMESQADYFSLVNEIQKPGSTQKGKLLTLYTARPTADRERYQDAQTLPVNIFLTNSFDHVLGLASDLAGSGGMRDVWKVRMDSRYLTQTLEGPVQYYQVTVPAAPVKSMDLVHSEGG